jgi:hypothetical protein
MVMPRTETMTGYNHIELDEVHTPSRYFALLSYCCPGRSIVHFWRSAFHVANQIMSFPICRPGGPLSEASLNGHLATNSSRTATRSH